jgi:hypothetical protein
MSSVLEVIKRESSSRCECCVAETHHFIPELKLWVCMECIQTLVRAETLRKPKSFIASLMKFDGLLPLL